MAQLSLSHKLAKEHRTSSNMNLMPKWTWHAWRRVLILMVIGFLLGRANIDHVVSPFALSYLAVLSEVAGRKKAWPAYFAIIGAYTTGGIQGGLTTLLAFVLYRVAVHLVFRKKSPDLHFAPLTAGIVGLVSQLAMYGTALTRSEALIALAQGALVTILALIFIQCMNLFVGQEQSRSLKYEQMLSVVILVASVVMGFVGITVDGVALSAVAVDWLILVICCGGIGVSAAGALVVSMLTLLSNQSSLAHVAILGFAGLLCGLLKDTHRLLIGIVMIASTTILTATQAHTFSPLMMNLTVSGIAVVLFMITPKRLEQEIRSYVPGTREHTASERERVQRVNSLLTEKIQKVSHVFDELSVSFADDGETEYVAAQQLVTKIISSTSRSVCATCPRRSKCWDKESMQTYHAMANTLQSIEKNQSKRPSPTKELRDRCIRLDAIMKTLKYNLDVTHRDAKWMTQLREHRTLLSAQLSGIASVVRGMAVQLEQEQRSSLSEEEQIIAALEQLGLYVDDVQIISLEPGKVEIEMTQPTEGAHENSIRMIAPLLSGILGEHINVSEVRVPTTGGPYISVFTSARLYQVQTAVASVARDGKMVSGDTHTSVDLGNGRHAIAVSDGMGNGERARRESKAAIDLLKKLMRAGFDEKLAIQTVNSTLLLRSREEMFTTLDMALVDLFSAKAEFLKVGSAPSYIKRGRDVIEITGDNIPIGILQEIEVQTIEQELQAGDMLILMSDGLYDAPPHKYDMDTWLRTAIERLETTQPQEIADTLIETAVRMNHGTIRDDMTVMVAVIERQEREWAAIKLPSVPSLKKSTKRQQGA